MNRLVLAGGGHAHVEVLRRRKTHLALRNDALTDRALLVLESSRRSLNPRDWGRRRGDPEPQRELEAPAPIRKDEEMRRIAGSAKDAVTAIRV